MLDITYQRCEVSNPNHTTNNEGVRIQMCTWLTTNPCYFSYNPLPSPVYPQVTKH